MRAHRSRNTRTLSVLGGVLVLSILAGCSQRDKEPAIDTTAAVNVAATLRPVTDSAPLVTVYKSPTCTCCTAWVDHMKESGFRVVSIDTSNLDAIKRRYGIAPEHAACHTAIVGEYVVEGHVPADDVRRLLAQRPAIIGLAVPGRPAGSPGMEGAYKQSYEVLAFARGGVTTVFAKH